MNKTFEVEENIIDMSNERKAAMVSNLLVVSTSQSQHQLAVQDPLLRTGDKCITTLSHGRDTPIFKGVPHGPPTGGLPLCHF